MQRLLTTLLTLMVIGLAGSFVGAPFFAFFAVRSAAEAQDVQGLAELVDYDAVRLSLRGQIGGDAAAALPAPSVWTDPVGALRHAIEPIQAGPAVDSYLTPPALAALTRGAGREARNARPIEPAEQGLQPLPRIRYWGVNRCRLAVENADGRIGETVFSFERKALFTWKLAHIGLPRSAPAAPTEPQ